MILLLSLLSLFFVPPAVAATDYGAALDYLPRGARALAMGGTGSASVSDAYSPFYNPAAMAEQTRPQFIVEYTPLWNLGDDFGTGSLVFPFDTRMAVGAYYSRLEVNAIPYFADLPTPFAEDRYNDISTQSTGIPLGYFYDTYEVYCLSLAKWYTTKISQEVFYKLTIPVTLSGGASIKLFRQSFTFDPSLAQPAYEGQSSDLDIGALLSFTLDKDLATGRPTKVFKVGYSLKNLLQTDIAWNTDRNYRDNGERIRLLGLSYSHAIPFLKGALNLATDFIRHDNDQVQRYGAEFAFMDKLFLRSGWMDNGFTAGIGIRHRFIGIDYAFQQHELKNHPYQISLSISF